MHAPPVALEVVRGSSGRSATSTPASQKSWLRGVWRSNQTVLPSQLHHSWPLISMSIVRLCISRMLAAVGADGPGPIQLVPGAFVAIEQQAGIDGIELQVIQVAVLEAGLARFAGMRGS